MSLPEKRKKRRAKRKLRGKKQKSMFGPAKDKHIAEVVSLESPADAQDSIDSLERMFDAATSHRKKMHILRATTLAANRAEAMRIRVGPKERKELTAVAKKYRKSSQGMSAIMSSKQRRSKRK